MRNVTLQQLLRIAAIALGAKFGASFAPAKTGGTLRWINLDQVGPVYSYPLQA
jgi:hypothetical protein